MKRERGVSGALTKCGVPRHRSHQQQWLQPVPGMAYRVCLHTQFALTCGIPSNTVFISHDSVLSSLTPLISQDSLHVLPLADWRALISQNLPMFSVPFSLIPVHLPGFPTGCAPCFDSVPKGMRSPGLEGRRCAEPQGVGTLPTEASASLLGAAQGQGQQTCHRSKRNAPGDERLASHPLRTTPSPSLATPTLHSLMLHGDRR